MGQFKPMVKMETTEPSIMLKLKKGGHVSNKKMESLDKAGHKKMANGGAMGALAMNPALVGRPAVNAPVAAPGKPSMADRRQAMMAKKPMPSAMMAKEGGKADMSQDKAMIKKAIKQHDAQEHKGGVGTKLKLKSGGKMATGGVLDGQGGFKTGGVAKANGGGFKQGGSAKKHFATGGKVNSGAPVAMKTKPAAKPIRINELTGTYKKGGSVAHKQVGGGMMSDSSRAMMDELDRGYKDHYANEAASNLATTKAVDDALMFLPRKAMQGMGYLKNKLMGQGAVSDAERSAVRQIEDKGLGAITDQEREAMTTVIPARRRGGSIKK